MLEGKTSMTMTLTREEVAQHLSQHFPQLGNNHTGELVRPPGHPNIAAVRHEVNNNRGYDYSIITVVKKTPDGTLRHQKILDTHNTRQYCFPRSITLVNETEGTVDCGDGPLPFSFE